MGSGTRTSKIDGFPGTNGTHTNGATDSMLSTGYHFETVTPVSSGFWFISLHRKQCAFAVKEKTLL